MMGFGYSQEIAERCIALAGRYGLGYDGIEFLVRRSRRSDRETPTDFLAPVTWPLPPVDSPPCGCYAAESLSCTIVRKAMEVRTHMGITRRALVAGMGGAA